MNTPGLKFVPRAGIFQVALCAALLVVAGAADAKGKKGSSSGGSSAAASKADKTPDEPAKSSGFKPNINVRSSSSGSSSSSSAGTAAATGVAVGAAVGTTAAIAAQRSAEAEREEAARRAAHMAAMEKAQAEKTAAQRSEAEKAEAERQAVAKAEADRAAQRTAEEKAEAARLAAEDEKRKREMAVVNADVERVLTRAKDDYPILKTREGDPMLQRILRRQQELIAQQKLYPSVALVEAVADHSEQLKPRPKPVMMPVSAPPAPSADSERAFAGCRWATPTLWTCKPADPK